MTVSQSCLWIEPRVPAPQTTLLHSPAGLAPHMAWHVARLSSNACREKE